MPTSKTHAARRFCSPAVLLRSVRLDPAARLPDQRCLHVYRNNAVLGVATSDRITKQQSWSKASFSFSCQLLRRAPISLSTSSRPSGRKTKRISVGSSKDPSGRSLGNSKKASSFARPTLWQLAASGRQRLQAKGRSTKGFAKPRFSTHQASLPQWPTKGR